MYFKSSRAYSIIIFVTLCVVAINVRAQSDHNEVGGSSASLSGPPETGGSQSGTQPRKANPTAVEELEQQIELNPTDWLLYNQLAVELTRRNYLDRALAAMTRAIELNPDEPDLLFNQSILLDHLGRTDDAVQAVRRSIELRPSNIRARQQLCELLMVGAKFSEAVTCNATLLVLTPSDPLVYARYAYSLAYSNQRQKAEQVINDAEKLFPTVAEIQNAKGMMYFTKGEYKAAREWFRKALAQDPASVAARFNLALSELKNKNREGAIFQYSFMKTTDPTTAQRLFEVIFRDKIVYVKNP